MRRTTLFIALTVGGIALASGLWFARPRPHWPGRAGQVIRPLLEHVDDEPLLVSTIDLSASSPTWSRFRGPNGLGISNDTQVPTTWSDTENVKWKTKLPGPGSSSPVLSDTHLFLTAYSGYGEDRSSAGAMANLKRHVFSINRTNGQIAWSQTIDAVQPEDPYQGMGVPEHGYATNTPVTDGENLFAFLGKSGVYAFDKQGNELWHVSVGTESGNRRWGSASSLTLYGGLLIVNAAEESQTLIALDKATGTEVWKTPAATLELSYGTPAIVHVEDAHDELVLAVPGEIWGMNPLTGKLLWYVETKMTDNLSPSIIVDGDRIIAFGGYRSSGSMAVRVGGKGDVTKTHVVWSSRNTSYVATPVLHERRLTWIDDRGMFYVANADTGELIKRARVPGIESGERPVYASPIVVANKIFAQTRNSGLFVLESADDLKIVAHNKFAADKSSFNATPAVDGGHIYLRSYNAVYCIGPE